MTIRSSVDTTAAASSPMPRSASETTVPATIGAWELLERIGQGEMAEVYRARAKASSPTTPASYAIKVVRPRWQDDPRLREMLRREVHIGRSVSNPHLVPILAAGLLERPRHIVMPLLEGHTFGEMLSGGRRVSVPIALWIARQVAVALQALVAEGWMHADVKPSNILVSPAGHVTLIDLGFAQRISEMATMADRPILGTLNYIAPELLTSKLPADVRSDIFSLGVTLFRALSGRLPFEASDLAALANMHRQSAPRELGQFCPQVPRGVAQLVQSMIAKEPLRRPQSPGELAERLAELEIDHFADRDAA